MCRIRICIITLVLSVLSPTTHWNEAFQIVPEKHPTIDQPRPVFSYKLRYIVDFGLVKMAISTNPKPTIYRNLYEITAPSFIGREPDLALVLAKAKKFSLRFLFSLTIGT